ncbi:nitrilase-related carbon-nitrogen hydrolase [Hyphococcus sp.]|uniref:nitrilase-related carbon-nitrogen hydrolase n=1 Tax=Hyphococcus sp. TaxID=2038636 RepID=UPI003CCC243C
MSETDKKPTLVIRNAVLSDVPEIAALSARVYGEQEASSEDEIRGQINNFAEGQYVAEYEGRTVGYCATFIIGEEPVMQPHSWMEITGGGFASRHDPNGDYLYGMEVSVDPSARRLRIGQRFYKLRRELCEYMELKGIVFGGRLPGYARREKEFANPWDYVNAVVEKRIKDQVINFQIAQGFEPIGILPNYLTDDHASRGYAVHMIWRNPLAPEVAPQKSTRPDSRLPDNVRVATVQFQMRRISRIREFEEQVEYFVDVAADYKADFVVFPELFTLQLLSLETEKLAPAPAIAKVAEYKDRFCAFMGKLAVSYNINIVGGTHPTCVENGDIRNVSYVFLRDGSMYSQDKLHPTPAETTWWNIKGGEGASVIPTDCGPIGVMVCYDSEFPEIARHLVDQGAMLLFVPMCTDERRGYLRVRYCCQARAVENQCYVVLSGVVGNLPNVENMDIHYAESCILTPSDFAFARDGVAADTAPNTETIALADLSLQDLLISRQSGAVQNLKNRRFDLYNVRWKGRRV